MYVLNTYDQTVQYFDTCMYFISGLDCHYFMTLEFWKYHTHKCLLVVMSVSAL